jgi:CheY-like chemotaxis protein/two-component sensor histidine kinase
MTHEIRTPMNAVIGLSNILAMSQPLTPKQKEFIQTLQLSADSLLSLINDLLDIAKIESRSIELEQMPFSMMQLLNEVISMMSVRAKEKGLEFTATNNAQHRDIYMGDPTRLRQIVLNLCSNAIKFTEKGGVYINIFSEASESEDVDNVSIAVTDTGIGIPADVQNTIFYKFIQADSSINRKYGGTGLGLAITKTLVEMMGGSIALQSAPDEGSTFTVKIPLKIGRKDNIIQLPTKNDVKGEPLHGPKQHILLVEDFPANVLVAGTYLEDFGYSYDVVENGYQAIEKAKHEDYLAILMDVQMHGINGFETTKLIRINEKETGKLRTPIIGMTAHALLGDRERCIAAEMDDYLSKPYNPDELKEKLAIYANKNKSF